MAARRAGRPGRDLVSARKVIGVTPDERWLEATWPFISTQIPPPPATIVDVGCGSYGGFVPALLQRGYHVTGVDPTAPESSSFQRLAIERYEAAQPVDAVVASTSLHHVADLDVVLGKIATMLVPAGVVIVVEMAWERIDEATARWCFDRLPARSEPSWLSRRRDEWIASGEPWGAYFAAWARREGFHRGDLILDGLDDRFERKSVDYGPYFFPDLGDTGALDEQVAIDAAEIQATSIRYVGRQK